MQTKQRRLIIRTIILAVLAAVVAYVIYANFTKEEVKKLKVGDQAPNFVLQDLEGNKHKLSDYEGKGVFLNFWATWCKPCEYEMPDINNQYKVFKDQGVVTIAVNNAESDFAVRKYIDRLGLSFPVILDKDRDVVDAYGIKPLPTTIMIDPTGEITHISSGTLSEEEIEELMESVKP